LYQLLLEVAAPVDLDSWIARSSRWGVLEHVDLPMALIEFSLRCLRGGFTLETYTAVPRRAVDSPYERYSSPFSPTGRWKRVPAKEFGLAAELVVPISKVPYSFSNALDRLLQPYLFHVPRRVTLVHEAAPPRHLSRST
jgi:hypothetical protein